MHREPRHSLRPWLLALVAPLALVMGRAACEGTASPPRPVAQGSGASAPSYYDSGSYPAPDGSSWPQIDSGSWPSLDSSASTGNLSCSQIWDCYDKCSDGDTTCYDACYNQGTANGQSKMDTLEQCWSQAETTTCKTECSANPDSQACWDCEDLACTTELQACD